MSVDLNFKKVCMCFVNLIFNGLNFLNSSIGASPRPPADPKSGLWPRLPPGASLPAPAPRGAAGSCCPLPAGAGRPGAGRPAPHLAARGRSRNAGLSVVARDRRRAPRKGPSQKRPGGPRGGPSSGALPEPCCCAPATSPSSRVFLFPPAPRPMGPALCADAELGTRWCGHKGRALGLCSVRQSWKEPHPESAKQCRSRGDQEGRAPGIYPRFRLYKTLSRAVHFNNCPQAPVT